MVGSHLDYCYSIWAPYKKGDIELKPTICVFFRICLSTFPVNHNGLLLLSVVDFLGTTFSMASCSIPLNKFHKLLDDSNFELISDI